MTTLDFIRELGLTKKNQIEILDLKNAKTEIKK